MERKNGRRWLRVGKQDGKEEAGWKGDREKSRKEGGSRVKRKVGE